MSKTTMTMTMNAADCAHLLAARIENGLSTIIVTRGSGGDGSPASSSSMPPLPKRIAAIHIHCEDGATVGSLVRRRPTAHAPLQRAARLVHQLFERVALRDDESSSAPTQLPLQPSISWIRDQLNRMAHRLPGRVVLVLEQIDQADVETHETLAALLRNDEAPLLLPLIMTIVSEPRGSFVEVANAVDEFNTRRTSRVAADAGARAPETPKPPPTTTTTTKLGKLDAHVKIEQARLRWLEVGLDPTFTLPAALDLAFEASVELGERASRKERVEIATLIADIAYDLGDGASLERALTLVEQNFLALNELGAEDHAALLLNDMASLRLRMGQPLPAIELLEQSLQTLAEQIARLPAPAALRVHADFAHTRHLLARLPLHPRTPEVMPIEAALEHAVDAASTFAELGRRHDEARVVETIARLEAKRGDRKAAHEAFATALRMADEIGDATTLARITAGIAMLLNAEGAADAALSMLTTSIELNRFKASPVGLAFDEQLLVALEDAVETGPEAQPTELARRLREAREQLRAAILDEQGSSFRSTAATTTTTTTATTKEVSHHGHDNRFTL